MGSNPVEDLDELHVVSDLHLGGTDLHRIISKDSVKALAGYINALSEQDRSAGAPHRIGLVINGDIVDFLADEDAVAFDPVSADSKLRAIVANGGYFAEVFRALRDFTRSKSNRLVLIAGNHDVELALPKVRDVLLQTVCDDPRAAQANVRFALDGEVFRCRVGGREVCCVHGNDVDTWNLVDHERVREYARWPEQGLAWIPNAGTQLVIDVMNDIKRDWPFIDLLKPEGVHFVPLLALLDRSKLAKIAQIFALGSSYFKGWLKLRGFLSDEGGPAGVAPDLDAQRLITLSKRGFDSPAELLARAERNFRDHVDPRDLAGPADDQAMLGPFLNAFSGWIRGLGPGKSATRSGVLRVLQGLMDDDRSFDFRKEDSTFEQLDRSMDTSIDFLIAGHTHLERALRRRRGNGFYFNSGTWIRLIPLDQYHLASEEAFEPLYQALPAKDASGRVQGIDALDPFDLKRRTAVAIYQRGDKVVGELRHVKEDGAYDVVPGSRMPRDSEGG